MSLASKIRDLSTKQKIIASSVIIAVITAIVIVVIIMNKGYYATSMRLLRIEGTVNIEDANGNSKPVLDNVRFSSGEALSTGSDGLAQVGLDDTKIVTLQSDSRVEFTKKQNMLELNLTQGAIFFEVTEHLSSDETFDIRTSNMLVGIRGTSGYVYYDEDGRESLVITDGTVHVVATNPDTGEVRETDVPGGCEIKVYLYSDREEDTVEFHLEQLTEEQLPDFVLTMLSENPDRLDIVCSFTNWDSDLILELANGVEEPETEETQETEETEVTEETYASESSADEDTDITPTPEPSNTPTPTRRPGTTPTPVPSVTPAADATGTPTPTPSTTATPTPMSTPSSSGDSDDPAGTSTPEPTAEPTAEPTSEPTATPTPTDTPTPTPTATPTPETFPEIPQSYIDDGYSEYTGYYTGENVFIITNGEAYMGYVDGDWIGMSRSDEVVEIDDDGGRHTYIYLVYWTATQEEVRYTCIAETYLPP